MRFAPNLVRSANQLVVSAKRRLLMEWINVKDKTPDGESIAIKVIGYTPTTGWVGEIFYDRVLKMWGNFENGTFRLTKVYISKWMPMPEPPTD